MLKVVLHALATSESPDTPFLVVLLLLVWEDTPWNSPAICGHHMSTRIRIPAGHMRFVPAHKQSDEATPVLSLAKWSVEFVLITNAKGWETFICHDRIHQIPSPAIQATCLLTPGQTLFSRPHPPTGVGLVVARPHPLGGLSLHDRRHPPNRHRAARTHRQTEHIRQQYLESPNHTVGYPPQHFSTPNTRGIRGNRHSTRESHGRYCSRLTRCIGDPASGSRIHLFPTAPRYGGHTRLPYPTH